MIKNKEKTMRLVLSAPMADVRSWWVARVHLEKRRNGSIIDHYLSHGFERVSVPAGAFLTSDGREVITIDGVTLALLPNIHASRRAEALETALADAKMRSKSSSPEVRESMAAVMCPQMVNGKPCSGTLNRKGVCPSCITGKMGYKYRYTCESCGFDIVTKTELSE